MYSLEEAKMLCDICGKNMATVHLTEIIDNNVTELHLCEECAREKRFQLEPHFGLSALLAGLADFGIKPNLQEAALTCSNCGLTYKDFKKIGRLFWNFEAQRKLEKFIKDFIYTYIIRCI